MTGPPVAYLCHVIAEGPVYGSGEIVPFVLDTLRTRSQDIALTWLRKQALRLADGLDPDPARAPWATRCERTPIPDAPTELRVWAADPTEDHAARTRLDHGVAVSVVIPDGPDRYTLAISPRPARVLYIQPFFHHHMRS
ncbi:hypothetical protein ACFVIM_27005 [Streptomyces sp. NPDC057638]|uniref:hypothetical protein n=1 Tax=Streptomyces sp. NPDC057638 TaxID=3346190 RepID=UPI003681ED74